MQNAVNEMTGEVFHASVSDRKQSKGLQGVVSNRSQMDETNAAQQARRVQNFNRTEQDLPARNPNNENPKGMGKRMPHGSFLERYAKKQTA